MIEKVRYGLTFIEVLIAILFMAVSVTFVFVFFTQSNSQMMDSYNEAIAITIAQEGIELIAGLGYDKLTNETVIENIKARFGIGEFKRIGNVALAPGIYISYPTDYTSFERKFDIIRFPDNDKLLKVTVTVRPIAGISNRFFTNEKIMLSKLVGADFD